MLIPWRVFGHSFSWIFLVDLCKHILAANHDLTNSGVHVLCFNKHNFEHEEFQKQNTVHCMSSANIIKYLK